MTRILTAVLLVLSVSIPAQKKPDPLREELDKAYAKLAAALEQHKIDSKRDTLSVIEKKQRAVDAALEAFKKQSNELMLRREYLGLDYVRFVEATFPRLSGRVLSIGDGKDFEDLASAWPEIRNGDVVLLGPGAHELPRQRDPLQDVAFVGMGADKTTFTGQLENVQRVRLTAVKIDCRNDPFVALRRGGSIQVQKCEIANYNSGAGGSNAMYGTGVTFLVENCKFEGLSGRAEKSGNGGHVFDVRGRHSLYVRGCDFVDNNEIVRVTGFCVFDRCRSMTRDRSASGITPYDEGFLLTRKNLCRLRGEATATFEFASDDREMVFRLIGRKADVDAQAAAAAEALGLRDNPRYWATLLHHEDREIRFAAQGKLTSLLRRALPRFKSDSKVLKSVPPDMRKAFLDALRSSHALQWLEQNERDLVWNKRLKAFELRK